MIHVMMYHNVPNRDLLAAETMSRFFVSQLATFMNCKLIFQKIINLKNLKNFT